MRNRLHKLLLGLFLVCTSLYAQAQEITLTTQWLAQSQFVGYYVADHKGFFREAGLDVRITQPSASAPALNRLVNGRCQAITLQLLQAIQAMDKGVKLVNILQTSQRNGLLVVPADTAVHSIEQLRGKKVGVWHAGFSEPLFILNHERQLNFEWVPYTDNVSLLMVGAIDAIAVMSYNEYFKVLSTGFKPATTFAMADYGLDIPEDGLYVLEDYYRTHQKKLKRLAEACRRGWQYAIDHPEEALKIVIEEVENHHINTNATLQKVMLKEILRLMVPADGDRATFTLKPEDVKYASDHLKKGGFIHRDITYEELTGKHIVQ